MWWRLPSEGTGERPARRPQPPDNFGPRGSIVEQPLGKFIRNEEGRGSHSARESKKPQMTNKKVFKKSDKFS